MELSVWMKQGEVPGLDQWWQRVLPGMVKTLYDEYFEIRRK